MFHFLIPVLNFIVFLFFEEKPRLKFWHTFVGLSHLLAYAIFYLVVVFTHVTSGSVPLEYDWYAFAQKGLVIAFVCAVVVIALGYLIAFLLYKINNRNQKTQAK